VGPPVQNTILCTNHHSRFHDCCLLRSMYVKTYKATCLQLKGGGGGMLESGAFSCMVLNQLWFAPYKHGCPANFFCLSVCNMLWIPQWTKGRHVCICIWVVPVVGTSNLKNVQIWCIFQVMSKEVTAYLTTMSRTNSYHKTKRPPHRVSWFCFCYTKGNKAFLFLCNKIFIPIKKNLESSPKKYMIFL